MRFENLYPGTKTKTVILLIALFALTACAKKQDASQIQAVSGGRSGVIVNDILSKKAVIDRPTRSASLLGVFVSQYLAENTLTPVFGGLNGIQAQTILEMRQNTVTDPDFALLQAFADVLQVDVPDMLNRSINRQETLDTYSNALTNVATRANERYKELSESIKSLKDVKRQKNRELSEAKRNLKKAITDKNFSLAGDLQKMVTEKEQEYSTADLQEQQVQSIVDTLDPLLTLFGQRILSIQRNREALIAGTRVVDMPGVADLNIIQKGTLPRESGKSHDAVFNLLEQDQAQTGSGQ